MSRTITREPAVDAASRNTWTRSIAGLVLGTALLLLLFVPEIRAAVEIWNTSTAYGHCYLVVPMCAYLLWDRQALIRRATPVAEIAWLVLVLPIVAGWLLADRLGIMEGRQLVAVAAFQILFVVVLGRRLYWQLSGPLLFLVFAVPFGAFITPTLQHFTADFTILGLNLLGVPHYADNFIIETPAGTFLVAEACAGLRFLIAAIAFGVFYALLTFRSPVRRAAYIGLAIIVPIIANGFRAFGIVYLGQVLGSAEAAAADHVIYGWIFFSFVMLLLVAVGQPFREATVTARDIPPAPTRRSSVSPVLAALAVVLCVSSGPAAVAAIEWSARSNALAGDLEWIMPTECRGSNLPADASSTKMDGIVCGPRSYRVTVRTYPSRSTSRAMMADRRRQTGELTAEDTSATKLGGTSDGFGQWTLLQTTEPDGAVAVALWSDGVPSGGGLRGRFEQARDSIVGSAYQPVLVLITALRPGRAGTDERRATMADLERIVAAQTSLTTQIERISRVGAGR